MDFLHMYACNYNFLHFTKKKPKTIYLNQLKINSNGCTKKKVTSTKNYIIRKEGQGREPRLSVEVPCEYLGCLVPHNGW